MGTGLELHSTTVEKQIKTVGIKAKVIDLVNQQQYLHI